MTPHDRADRHAVMVEEAIFAIFAHIHEVVAAPAEQLAVEVARGDRVGGRQLVPADALLGWSAEKTSLSASGSSAGGIGFIT